MKIHFLFLTTGEIKNSNIWEIYFREKDVYFDISIFSEKDYHIKNDFFSKYQFYDSFNSQDHNVECKYDFLNRNWNKSDYFIFLTEDSIPIKSLSFLNKKLSEFYKSNKDKSIFGFELDPHVSLSDGRNKYGEIRNFDFPENLRYKNNDLVCLSKKHAKLLADNKLDCQKFFSNFGGQHFISSILNKNGELPNIYNANIVMEDWDGYNNTPSIFNSNDFEKIKSIIELNEYTFFLRKFEDEHSNLELYLKLINLEQIFENRKIDFLTRIPEITEDQFTRKKSLANSNKVSKSRGVRGILGKNTGKI